MQYNPKTKHTCPVCNQSKPCTKANWMEAEAENNSYHEKACRDCILEREARLRASPPCLRIIDVIKRLDNRVKKWANNV